MSPLTGTLSCRFSKGPPAGIARTRHVIQSDCLQLLLQALSNAKLCFSNVGRGSNSSELQSSIQLPRSPSNALITEFVCSWYRYVGVCLLSHRYIFFSLTLLFVCKAAWFVAKQLTVVGKVNFTDNDECCSSFSLSTSNRALCHFVCLGLFSKYIYRIPNTVGWKCLLGELHLQLQVTHLSVHTHTHLPIVRLGGFPHSPLCGFVWGNLETCQVVF